MCESLSLNQSYPPHASLYLRGKDLDPQNVTDILGIVPQKSFKRGDVRRVDNKRKHGLWMLWSSERIDSLDPILHIKWWLKQIEPVKNELIELIKRSIYRGRDKLFLDYAQFTQCLNYGFRITKANCLIRHSFGAIHLRS